MAAANSTQFHIAVCDDLRTDRELIECIRSFEFDLKSGIRVPISKHRYNEVSARFFGYYVDGAKNYAGLIWCDGPEGNEPGYYYINSKCKLITDCTYWISKNNGYMKNGNYTFDADGKMIQA